VAAKSQSPDVKGFTLIEVMMAAAVMSLSLVGMIQVIVSGSEMLDMSRRQTIAMQIIHGQIDNVRLSDWSTVNAYSSPRTVNVDSADQSSNISYGFVFGSNLPGISRGFQCTRTISTVRTDLLQITFTVTWRSSTGRTYQRTGSTYYGNNGLYVTYQRS
jgi:prepilin-type N-terminal cleavage/methylation domain-containing protein